MIFFFRRSFLGVMYGDQYKFDNLGSDTHILTQFIVGVRLSKDMFIITTCHYETIMQSPVR